MPVSPFSSFSSKCSSSRSSKAWLASLLLLQVFHPDPLRAMDDPRASSSHASRKQLDELREGMVESLPTSLPPYGHASPKEDHAERQALFNKVIEVTHAEYDWPYHVKKSLEQFISSCQDPELQKKLETLLPKLKSPESLLLFGPGETETILYREALSPQHRVFATFRLLFEDIDALLVEVEDHSTLHQELVTLKGFYNKFVTSLCTASPEEKGIILAPKVLLKSENSKGRYRISQATARAMISKDKYGFVQKQNKTGMRAVRSLNGVHFKALDNALDESRPGLEYMAYAFAKAFTSEFLITPSTLLRLEGVSLLDPTENFPTVLTRAKGQGKSLDEALAQLHSGEGGWQQHVRPKDHSFFLQATQTIGDKNLDEALEENPSFTGDPVNLSWQLLFALLTNPGDAKADNYAVLTQAGKSFVIGIDNDKLFYPALYKDKGSLETGIKCVLYALSSLMENPLDDEVIQAFRALNPTKVALQWLGYLQDQNQRYNYLIQQGVFTDRQLQDLGLPMALPAGIEDTLIRRIVALQTQLRDHSLSLGDHLLHSLNPTVAEYYQAMRRLYPHDPKATMWVIYKGRDESGTPQPINKVLNLAPKHEAWTQASSSRVPAMNQELISCIKSFFQSLDSFPLRGAMADILNLTLHHFNGYEDEFLPRLPLNVWHLVSQEETKLSKKDLAFLLKRDPQGLNRLDSSRKTPLDYAFETLLKTGKIENVISLIEVGAGQMTFALPLYQALKEKGLPPAFWQSFKKLERWNAKIGWTATLEELFPLAPRSSKHALFIEGTRGERRLLTQDIFRQMSDPTHQVTQEPREVYWVESQGHKAFIKFYPALVGLEHSIGELTRQVIGFGAPHGELFRLPDGRPVWICQAIHGQTLQEALTNNSQQLNHLDPISTTKLILMAMLINPEDGKPANYIMEPLPDNPTLYRLASPDNDQGLVPAFVKTKPRAASLLRSQEVVVQVKTVLYCLDLMNQPIPQETRQTFLKQDPLTLMKEWMGSMQEQMKGYGSLYPNSQEMWKLFQEKECFLGLPFQKGMISHLYSKWSRLQDYLAQDNLKLTPLELLSKLEPRLANRYREAFQQKDTTWDRFVWVDGPFYQQKGNSWSTLTPSGSILGSQNIPLQETILESIHQGKSLGPIQALQELNTLIEQKGQSGLSLDRLESDYAREQFLKDFDFASHPLSTQRQLLNQLIPHAAGLNHISLKNCIALTDSILQKSFLHGQIVHLDLRGCPITHEFLPLLANTNPGLEELNLSGATGLRWVAEAGYMNYYPIVFNQLTYLNLNDCSALEAIDMEAPKLKQLWANWTTKLSHLKIQGPALQSLSCQTAVISDQVLYQLLPQTPTLTHLDITNCAHISNIAKKVCAVFQNDPTLTEVDLLRHNIGAAETKALAKGIQHNTTLNILSLSYNQTGTEGLKDIALALKDNTSLTSVTFWSDQINEEGPKALALALEHNTTLTDLYFWGNQIDTLGAKDLALALKDNTTLTTLDLRNNLIHDEGAKALALALKDNTALNSLTLCNSQISDEGAKVLAQALQYNTTLTSLDLSYNKIGEAGAQALAQALQYNTTLTWLILRVNEIGDAGAQALAPALQHNTTLTTLNLSWNLIGEAGAQALVPALQHNATLTTLDLSGNGIGDAGKQAFKQITTCKRKPIF
ncbi:MAG: hypothetical protein K0M45_00815 [Candidatus Paracaedibacteraceae bacterium]|nr:hypothetical protein [Candidatus Paracaedibacteraceae bacterium]